MLVFHSLVYQQVDFEVTLTIIFNFKHTTVSQADAKLNTLPEHLTVFTFL